MKELSKLEKIFSITNNPGHKEMHQKMLYR